MPMRCPKCGAEVEDEWPVCRKCFEPVKRPGFLARLFRKLLPGVSVAVSSSSNVLPGSTTRTVSIRTNQTFKFRDAKTGETREFHSLNDVPEQFRALLREAEKGALAGGSTTRISWTDPSGTIHHCNSIDELPPETRAIYEKAIEGKSLDQELQSLISETGKSGFTVKSTTKITWTDPSGTTHHCNSLDELPAAMRALYQKAMGDKEKHP